MLDGDYVDVVGGVALPQVLEEDLTTTTTTVDYVAHLDTLVSLSYIQTLFLGILLFSYIASGLLGRGWRK